MVMCATYTPAPRGWRVRGNVCYLHAGREGGVCVVLYTECCLHSGPEREACAWGTECCLHSGPEREACVWYGERPPPGEPRGRPHATNGPRVAVRHGSAHAVAALICLERSGV